MCTSVGEPGCVGVRDGMGWDGGISHLVGCGVCVHGGLFVCL